MKIYTKTGDRGETGLFGGPRVPKHHPRIEAFGEVDELNAALGTVRAEPLPAAIDAQLHRVQHELFAIGALLATPDAAQREALRHTTPGKRGRADRPAAATDTPDSQTVAIGSDEIARLERQIDEHESGLPPLKQFILPGGTRAAAALHLARTICRRAERRVVALAELFDEDVPADVIVYLNRLGDLLFVLARAANAAAGVADVPWETIAPCE